MIVTVYLTILLNMDGTKPAKSRWCPYNCLLCNDDHKGRVKEYNSFTIISVGYRERLGFRVQTPFCPTHFFKGKSPGNEVGIGFCHSSSQFDLLFGS